MNFNNFTIKSQEAIQKAVEITRAAGTQAIEPVCLLKGVMDEGETVVNFIFQKIGANASAVQRQVEAEISALPKVSGQEPYLSRSSNDVLQKALDTAKKMGDEYVTLEALLLAIFEVAPLPPPYSKTPVWGGKNSKQPSKSYARARKPPTKALKKHTTHCQNTL